MDTYDEAVLFTLTELESRLQRLEYLLGGPHRDTADKPSTVPDRLAALERALQQLTGKTTLLHDARELVRRHPDMLPPRDTAAPAAPDEPVLEMEHKAVLVVERATSFATVASQLKALDDQQIPTSDGFAKLALLQPRIAQAEARQLQQALAIADLRRRHGLLNQRYKQVLYAGAGRCWIDYHERLTKALRAVVREEFRRRPADEATTA